MSKFSLLLITLMVIIATSTSAINTTAAPDATKSDAMAEIELAETVFTCEAVEHCERLSVLMSNYGPTIGFLWWFLNDFFWTGVKTVGYTTGFICFLDYLCPRKRVK